MAIKGKAKDKKEVILKVVNKQMTQKEAAYELELSDRQIRRLVKKFKDEGEDGFMHKNTGKSNPRKIDESLIKKIEDDYIIEYYDYNFIQYYEERGYKYGISYQTMFKYFYRDDIVSPLAQHNTIKLYNERLNQAIKENSANDEEIKLYKERKREEKEKHFRKSILHLSFGEEVQMDATFYIWFGEDETALHLAVDRATKKILYGWFSYEETTDSYMILLKNIILNYGIPKRIKTDKRNSFSNNNAKSIKAKMNVTQFKRMCDDLEIELSCSSNPVFKANVERENGTVKGRLKAEFRHNGINDMESANKYLNEVFIPKLNEKFSYEINPHKNMMRKNTYTKEELDILLSIRIERTIDNASSIKYLNKYYQLINYTTSELTYFESGTKCTVVISYNKKLYGIIDGTLYIMVQVDEQQDTRIKASKNGFKPKANHPWLTKK